MRRWSRTRLQLFLFLVVFSLLLLSSIVHDERTIRTREASTAQPSFPTHFVAETFDDLDWSKACTTVRSYRAKWSPAAERRRQHQSREEGCDAFSGRWVHDNSSHPLYEEASCPYMSDQLACRKHGRPDAEYQRWRWQPHGCNLNKWNATEMLEKLRGKRLMFVGDSLNRGQWISMVCMVQSAIPDGKKSMTPNAALTIFRAEEYDATIEFYWAPLLVESNSDDPVNHRLNDRIIRPDVLGKHAAQWEKADILVFNSYLWWRSGPKIKLLWKPDDDGICQEANGPDAMKLAMETWADWVASTVNHLAQRVFFVTISPTHLWSREWNPGSEGNCFQETNPIDEEGYWGSGSDMHTMQMVGSILGRLQPKVVVLNITQLSEYRKDGHPSIYRKFWEAHSPQQLANPVSYADCIHWCLPGVPDVWNELLFNSL
ncbi:hypothetical protein MUK42_00939 [Musa troglodytarum]|uniref:Trichome birefringence-like N-terminal domain-containing protein n=1 Tax=Musa troglodytarum TaxID=320322 RepID=A0A9E7FD99_9LILI|nr:hypothetical protein MUK42_00939 [Musa troglodytarum]URD93291.1 hypothetical protein MUK42_00939 [Musa troglodytarum]